jgi:hypothetical protein
MGISFQTAMLLPAGMESHPHLAALPQKIPSVCLNRIRRALLW